MHKLITQLLLFLLMVPGLLAAAPPSGLPLAEAGDAGIASANLHQMSDLLQQHIDDGLVAGVVAGVARHGKVVYLESKGWQDIDNQQAMQDSSIFQIRSMSKAITAVAALQLVEQGKLALSDPVSKYIPRFGYMFVLINPDEPFLSAERKPTREITIEDLLLNTAGLSHRTSPLYQQRRVRSRGDNLSQLSNKVAGVPLIGDPGEQFLYSISLTIVGRIVEIVSGQMFDEYLQENVFDPLDMADTGFYVPDNKLDRLARAYQAPVEDQSLTLTEPMDIPITQNPPLLEGAAGMVSTIGDYFRFMQALLNGGELDGARILSADSTQQMLTNHLPESLLPIGFNPNALLPGIGWGYGIGVVVDEDQTSFGANNGEFGWTGSLGTLSWADPESQTITIFMVQINRAGARGLRDNFKSLVHSGISN